MKQLVEEEWRSYRGRQWGSGGGGRTLVRVGRAVKYLGVNGVVFFFQAEDGIRDLTVTGVQTCALPIFRQESALTQRVRQTEDAAAIDADEVGKELQRHRSRRGRNRFEDGQSAVQTLDRRRVEC